MKMVEQARRIGADNGQRIGYKAPAFEDGNHARLGLGGHLAHLAPGIGIELERPVAGNARVQLAQRPRRRIARIGEGFLATCRLTRIERGKIGMTHIDFAPDFDDIRHPGRQDGRDIGDRAHIGSDILALGTIAPGGGGHKLAGLVAQVTGQAVDLRLSGKVDASAVGGQKLVNTTDEISDIVIRKRIVERQHRHCVANLVKALGDTRSYLQTWRIRPAQVRKPGLYREIAAAESIILGVGDERSIFEEIVTVEPRNLGRKCRQFRSRLKLGQSVDRG